MPEHAQNTKGRYYANPGRSATSGVSLPASASAPDARPLPGPASVAA